MSLIDFSDTAQNIHNRIRAITGFAFINEKRLKIFRSELTGKKSNENPGTVIEVSSDFLVVCGDGEIIRFTEVQPEGSRRMKASDYLRGSKLQPGSVFTRGEET